MFIVLKMMQYLILGFGFYYLIVACAGLFSRRCRKEHPPAMRFAVIVPAHNEAKVIGNLVRNLKALEYPQHLFDIYVIADSCNDNTAAAARAEGAVVWERSDPVRRGKGYVLEYAVNRLGFTGAAAAPAYDAAVFFDADNLVSPNFLQAMNNHLLEGEKVIQGFVDSKNPADNWVTSAFSLTFWMCNRFILLSRYNLGLSGALMGTGMCIAREVLAGLGWSTVTLTEDLEYSVQALLRGFRTTFAIETRIYDEKPLHFFATCRQRLRWARGQINVGLLYAPRLLLRGALEGNLVKFEGGIRLLQLFVIALGGALTVAFLIMPAFLSSAPVNFEPVRTDPRLGLTLTVVPYLLPLLTLFLDRLPLKPFRYYPVYPLFCLSWIMIIIVAFFTWRNRQWMPTAHSRALDYHHLSLTRAETALPSRGFGRSKAPGVFKI